MKKTGGSILGTFFHGHRVLKKSLIPASKLGNYLIKIGGLALTFVGGGRPREAIKSEGMRGVNPLTDHNVKLVIRMQLVRKYSILC